MKSWVASISSVALLAAALLFWTPAMASAAPPANDNFSAAQVVGPALPISVPASTIEATAQPMEPNIAGNAPVSTIWFQWTAPAAGTVVVNLCGAGFTGTEFPTERFAVWTGAALNALVAVQSQAGDCLLRFNALATTVYSIQVDYGDIQGNFNFRMRQLAPPANDNFPGTTIGPALPLNLPSTNLDSTYQAGETAGLGGPASSRSIWYSWTAPANGPVRIDSCDFQRIAGAANRRFEVYTGGAIGALAVVATTTNCEINFTANAGTTYRIAFSGYIGGEGTFTFRMRNAPPPANDNFANAITAGPGLPVSITGDNEFATAEAGEPPHSGIGFNAARSVWFNWTPTQSRPVRIRACNREGKTRIGVYTGIAVNALTDVAQKPPYGPHCGVVVNAVAGTTYRIAAAGGVQDGAYGPFVLEIRDLAVPGNDRIADAITLTAPLPFSVTGTTVDATFENSEPSHELGASGVRTPSVWYRWTAPDAEPVIFSACSSSEPVRIAVYTTPEPDQLEQVTASGKGCAAGTEGGRLAIAPDAGTTYLIAVAAADQDWESEFTLSARGATTPPPVVTPPKAQFNLKKAIRKCKKIKSKKKRAKCIKKARKKAAIIKCRKIVNPAKEKQCIRKVQRKFK